MIIAYRMMIGLVGGGLFGALAFIQFFQHQRVLKTDYLTQRTTAPLRGLSLALMFLWMTFSTLATLDQVKYLPQPTETVEKITLREILLRITEALKNKYFRVLFVATLIASAVIGTGQVFDTYMNTFFWGFGPEELRWFALAFSGMALVHPYHKPVANAI